ncbi:MAG: LytR C-terminal domain-containing protein [Ignavibacteriae bacterium]|nr:LytR C-terminal domain-containing protein [Ignavibacteria bacterium]MBI3364308.1 LytR C-terminal domain-containing protein [Ignavibacteriota bacterium]
MDELDRYMQEHQPATTAPPRPGSSTPKLLLNVTIALGLVVAGYFSYTYIARSAIEPAQQQQAQVKPPRIIQLDVLNGCGARGAASKFTNYLRSQGFDVVEMKNYKVSTMGKTLVVDRVGDMGAARRVAAALGVSDKNVVQQLNPDYFVDVSIIIGADYTTLEPMHQ